ncbi:hypothetical protein SeLEV6574_g05311 [Synchytrium endobioticum]|uniref:Chromosome transmission fidelity protein 8 n=1 Tax=Synchytrium endobioticum TaxID=286115 RepID=A0A507CV53_9FUNG|nr:hypothetical protein SeLEV6574_g05311 [Synchytrium endobioticum]
MIIIPTGELHPQSKAPASQDWVILEIQGTLEINQVTFQNAVLGTLELLNQENPILTIGHHTLEGKRITLSKPFALLRRKEVRSIWSTLNSAAPSRGASRSTSRAASPSRTGAHGDTAAVDHPSMQPKTPAKTPLKTPRKLTTPLQTPSKQQLHGEASTPTASQLAGMAGAYEEDEDPFTVTPEWDTVCVIRYKYIFSKRPETRTVKVDHKNAIARRS